MLKSILKLEGGYLFVNQMWRPSFSDFLNFVALTTFRFTTSLTFTIIGKVDLKYGHQY